jgi:TIR domain/inactive STAND
VSPSAPTDTAFKVFFSYSHKDEDLRNELGKQLTILERLKIIQSWHDRNITAGAEWAKEISTNLETAHIILLLISADFLASDYCYEIELDRAMQRHEANEARVIPIILRSVDWQEAPFGKLQALPTGGKPVTSWSNRDEAFTDIVRGIKGMIKELRERQPPMEAEAEAPAIVTPVPRLLPYMCDRSDQEGELGEALHRHQTTMPRRPFVCIIHGDEMECHSEFLERLRYLSLPRALNLEAKQLSFEEYSLDWPSSGVSANRYASVFARNLGMSLMHNGGATAAEIVKHVATHEKPLVLTSQLLNENFAGAGPELLTAFLKFWDTFPDLPPGRTLISCVSLKHERLDQKGFFEKWKLQKLNENLRTYLGSLDFAAYRGVAGVVLSELRAIRRSDVETWMRSPAVRAICEIQERDIRALFQRVELVTPEGHISMEMLADELRNLVGKNRHQRN